MAEGILDRMFGFMGVSAEEEGETTEVTEKKGRSVLNVHAQGQFRVAVFHPTAFDEAQTLADCIRNRDAVIVNFERADTYLQQRIADFLNGVLYAVGGESDKISEGVVLFAPSNIDVTKETRYDFGNAQKKNSFLKF